MDRLLVSGMTSHLSIAPPQVFEMAYLKLHSLLQTVLCLSWEEVCFLLGQLGAHLWPGGVTYGTESVHPEAFPHLVPIVRTLLDQHADPVTLQSLLPNLPVTNGSATFGQDLKAYCHTLEWQGFYQQQVRGLTLCVLKQMSFILCLLSLENLLSRLYSDYRGLIKHKRSDTVNSVLCCLLV